MIQSHAAQRDVFFSSLGKKIEIIYDFIKSEDPPQRLIKFWITVTQLKPSNFLNSANNFSVSPNKGFESKKQKQKHSGQLFFSPSFHHSKPLLRRWTRKSRSTREKTRACSAGRSGTNYWKTESATGTAFPQVGAAARSKTPGGTSDKVTYVSLKIKSKTR